MKKVNFTQRSITVLLVVILVFGHMTGSFVHNSNGTAREVLANEVSAWLITPELAVNGNTLDNGALLKDGDIVTINVIASVNTDLSGLSQSDLLEEQFSFSLPNDFSPDTAQLISPSVSSFNKEESGDNADKQTDTEQSESDNTTGEQQEPGSSTQGSQSGTEENQVPNSEDELVIQQDEQAPLGAPDFDSLLVLSSDSRLDGYTDYTVIFSDVAKQTDYEITDIEFSVSFSFNKVNKLVAEIPQMILPGGVTAVCNYDLSSAVSVAAPMVGIMPLAALSTNLNDKVTSADTKLYVREYTETGREWVLIDETSGVTFDTNNYKLTVDWELNSSITGADIKSGDYFTVRFPASIDVTNISEFNVLHSSANVVGKVIQYPGLDNVKAVVFNENFSTLYQNETDISGTLNFEFYYEVANTGDPVTWEFSVGSQVSKTITGEEGYLPGDDEIWKALPLFKIGDDYNRNNPLYMYFNEWGVFVNRLGVTYTDTAGVLVDEWDDNQELTDYFEYCSFEGASLAKGWFLKGRREQGWFLSIPDKPDLPYFLVFKFNTKELMNKLNLETGWVNDDFDDEMYDQIDYILYKDQDDLGYKGINNTPLLMEPGADMIESFNYEPLNNRVTFNFKPEAFNNGDCYIIKYTTKVTDELASSTYENNATFSISEISKAYGDSVSGFGDGTASSRYGYFTIKKVDSDGVTPLEGASFKLTKPDGSIVTMTTKANGIASIYLNSTFQGKCTIEEMSPPIGYVVPTGKIEFTVYYDNTVESNKRYRSESYKAVDDVTDEGKALFNLSTVDTSVDSGLVIENNKSTLYEIKLVKADKTTPKKLLTGAEFTITGPEDGDSQSKTIEFNDKSELVITLDKGAGKYTLTETQAPDGYCLLSSSISFTVGVDGKITLGSANSNASVSNNGLTLTIYNEPKPELIVNLKKVDGNNANTPISGNTLFTLEKLNDSWASLSPVEKTNITTTNSELVKLTLGEGKYKLSETTPPTGYSNAESNMSQTFFEVKYIESTNTYDIKEADGKDNRNVNLVASGNSTFLFEAKNIKNPLVITVKKTGDGEKSVAGSKFVLTGPNEFEKEFVFNETTQETITLTEGFGDYILTETETNSDYHLRGISIAFNVNTDGKITLSGSYTGVASVDLINLSLITVTNVRASVLSATLSKKDELGAVIEGDAVFTLYKLVDGTWSTVTNYTINSNRPVALNLGEGTYKLEETSIPNAYKAAEAASISFTVTKNNNVFNIETTASKNLTISNPSANVFAFQATNYKKAVEITLKKVDNKSEFLPGAVFKLTGPNNYKLEGISIPANGYKVALPGAGEYTLTETTEPVGYHKLSSAINFTVDWDGKIDFDGVTYPGVASYNGSTLTVINTPSSELSVTLLKVDADTGIPVNSESTFEMYSIDADGNKNGASTFIVTGADGSKAIQNLDSGRYRLTETIPPAGYDSDEAILSSADFSISYSDGAYNVNIINANNLEKQDNGENSFTFIAENTMLSREITISKVSSETLLPLTGSVFELADSGGNIVAVDLIGVAERKYILAGTGNYTLTETNAPRGYHMLTEPISFELDANGKITLTGNNSLVSLSNDRLTIIIKNQAIAKPSAVLKKVDRVSGSPISSSAEFNLLKVDASGNRIGPIVLLTTRSASGSAIMEIETGRYELIETSVPAGYERSSVVHGFFTVSETGGIYRIAVETARSSNFTVVASGTNSFSFTGYNTPIEVTPVPEDPGTDDDRDVDEDIIDEDVIPPRVEEEVVPETDEVEENIIEETVIEETIRPEEETEEYIEPYEDEPEEEEQIITMPVPDNYVLTEVPNVYVMTDENGTPLGYFSPVLNDDGTIEWIEVDENGVPLGTIILQKSNPKTGTVSHAITIMIGLLAAALVALIVVKRKFNWCQS